GEPARRLLLAEDRLAELVQIEARPRCPPLRQVAPELVLLGGQDEGLALVAETRQDRGDDHTGEIVGHDAAEDQSHALPPLHEARRAVAVEEIGDLIGDALGTPAAKGLIGERDRQLLAARVLHHAREPARLRALIRRLAGQRLAQERLGQVDGAPGSISATARGGGGLHWMPWAMPRASVRVEHALD